ncbi:hypothetical protein [Prosthecobacter sp. SYSU 5D2]|uniref:hypothetical protein n=1 Tax=Prosthecobacter sp. SYSU 5D2 TaxID=3134134 RepID=UPI0031FED581
MIRLLSVGLVSASLMLASCATKKADCSSCCDSAADKKATADCCSKDKKACCDSAQKGHKH